MRLRSLSLVLICFGFISSPNYGQIGIPTFNKGNLSLKELLSDARQKDANILIISYSPKVPTDILPEIKNPDSILMEYPVDTDVIDPFIEMGDLVSYRLKQYANPGWTIIHPDNQILFYSNRIRNDRDLKMALMFASSLKDEYDGAKSILDQNKNDQEGLKKMITVISKMYEKRSINKYLNRFLKQVEGNYSKNLPFLIEIADRSPGNRKLDNYIRAHKNEVIRQSSLSQYISIRQKSVIAELKKRDIYEPYMIWQRFEEEFGVEADSLYRLQAIKYFNSNPEDKEYELEELIGFLDLYPDTPWEVLDPLYFRALQLIKSKDDLEIMLDLIGGQLFQGDNYRKLDYRALILYRLGQKERSLRMIQEVMVLAKKENPSYRSMIYGINKK